MAKQPLQYRVLDFVRERHSVYVDGVETFPELDFHEGIEKINSLTNFELLELLADLAEKEKADG